jgi:hypothetical protein
VSSAKRPRLECLTSLLLSDISMRNSRGPITNKKKKKKKKKKKIIGIP